VISKRDIKKGGVWERPYHIWRDVGSNHQGCDIVDTGGCQFQALELAMSTHRFGKWFHACTA